MQLRLQEPLDPSITFPDGAVYDLVRVAEPNPRARPPTYPQMYVFREAAQVPEGLRRLLIRRAIKTGRLDKALMN